MRRLRLLAVLLLAACTACGTERSSTGTSLPVETPLPPVSSGSYDPAALGDAALVRWATSFGAPGRDMVYGVAPLADATVLVGETAMPSADPAVRSVWSGFLRRIDASGATSWDRPLPGAAPGAAMSVAALEDGGVLVGGFASAPESSWVPLRGVLARFDAGGNVRWSREFSDLRHTTVYDVAVFQGRLFAVLGTAERFSLNATDAVLEGESRVSIVEFDANGIELASYPVGRMRSQDSSYMLAASPSSLVYVGDVDDAATLGVAAEVISFDAALQPRWRIVFDDPVLAGISAVLAAPDGSGRLVVHVGGHFREELRVAGRVFNGTTPVRRNGFIAALDDTGALLEVATLLPAGTGDWSTVYALAPLPDGSVLAAGEFIGSMRVNGRRFDAVGDLDTLLLVAARGTVSDVSVFGSLRRDGVLEVRLYADCSALLVGAAGGGRNEPNGEDVLLFRRSLADLRRPPC